MSEVQVKLRLAKCKRCGSREVLVEEDRGNWYALCGNERCGLSTVPFDNGDDAVQNWNMWNWERYQC